MGKKSRGKDIYTFTFSSKRKPTVHLLLWGERFTGMCGARNPSGSDMGVWTTSLYKQRVNLRCWAVSSNSLCSLISSLASRLPQPGCNNGRHMAPHQHPPAACQQMKQQLVPQPQLVVHSVTSPSAPLRPISKRSLLCLHISSEVKVLLLLLLRSRCYFSV